MPEQDKPSDWTFEDSKVESFNEHYQNTKLKTTEILIQCIKYIDYYANNIVNNMSNDKIENIISVKLTMYKIFLSSFVITKRNFLSENPGILLTDINFNTYLSEDHTNSGIQYRSDPLTVLNSIIKNINLINTKIIEYLKKKLEELLEKLDKVEPKKQKKFLNELNEMMTLTNKFKSSVTDNRNSTELHSLVFQTKYTNQEYINDQTIDRIITTQYDLKIKPKPTEPLKKFERPLNIKENITFFDKTYNKLCHIIKETDYNGRTCERTIMDRILNRQGGRHTRHIKSKNQRKKTNRRKRNMRRSVKR